MLKLQVKIKNGYSRTKLKIKELMKDETGMIGVKEIAVTIAVIVIIGAAVTAINIAMPGWIGQIWTLFIAKINELIA